MSESNLPLLKKLWIYQAERFPIFKTAALVAIFSAASISTSAHFAHRNLPHIGIFILAFIVTLLLFFELRVFDEIKDGEDDAKYRPERPIPRGLVKLQTIIKLGLLTIPIIAGLTLLIAPKTIYLVFFVWGWMFLMGKEFFVSSWLKAHPITYMVSHMFIMPLIDLFVTGTEWVNYGDAPHWLILFLILSFLNGCILEIGRKLWAPENEREGVETYSALYGPKSALILWAFCVVVSFSVLIMVGFATGAPLVTAIIGLFAFAFVIIAALKYYNNPTPKAQLAMDNYAGLWVFVCYAAAGYSPFIAGFFK